MFSGSRSPLSLGYCDRVTIPQLSVFPYVSIQYILTFPFLIIAEFLSYKTLMYILRMYTRTQHELTDTQKHKNYMASQSTALSFFRPGNLKSVFGYLFIIISSQNFSVRFFFSIAMNTLSNYETKGIKVTKGYITK